MITDLPIEKYEYLYNTDLEYSIKKYGYPDRLGFRRAIWRIGNDYIQFSIAPHPKNTKTCIEILKFTSNLNSIHITNDDKCKAR